MGMEFVPEKFHFKESKQTKPEWHRERGTWKYEGRVQDTSKIAADKLASSILFFLFLCLFGFNGHKQKGKYEAMDMYVKNSA